MDGIACYQCLEHQRERDEARAKVGDLEAYRMRLEHQLTEARAIARRLRADLRVYEKVAPGYSHLQGAADAFDALPWAKEDA
jgi:hypothetical protein